MVSRSTARNMLNIYETEGNNKICFRVASKQPHFDFPFEFQKLERKDSLFGMLLVIE